MGASRVMLGKCMCGGGEKCLKIIVHSTDRKKRLILKIGEKIVGIVLGNQRARDYNRRKLQKKLRKSFINTKQLKYFFMYICCLSIEQKI